jgi:HSP20 family protein
VGRILDCVKEFVMSLIPWKNKSTGQQENRLSPLVDFRSEMNRLFDSFLREPFGSLSDTVTSWGRWAPTLDVTENENAVMVRAEIPGVDPKEIDITVTGDRLTISGEKKETLEDKDREVYHRETRYGSFSRTVQLPAGVDAEKVSADYANGVLTVTLQKTPAARAKKISIKTAQGTNE